MSGKPRVLILGGFGFIGSHLVKYLVENDLTSKIRVADKTMLAMARLGKGFASVFEKVECVQVNLINPEGAAKAFNDPEGAYTIVFNLAAETKRMQDDKVYADGITKLSANVADEAAKRGVQKFVYVSTAEVYEASSKPCSESAALKPWTGIGKAQLAAEQYIREKKGLPYIIVRPAAVYGPGDTASIAPQACLAAVWKKKGEKLELTTWIEDSKVSTVHVEDVVRGLWHLASNGNTGEIYNLADKSDTDQKKIYNTLEKLLPDFKFGNVGVIQSEALKLMSIDKVIEWVNDQNVAPWIKLTTESKLDFTPLSPYVCACTISNKSRAVDGSAIEKAGFTYNHPTFGEAEVREQLKDAVAEGWFPPNMLQ